MTFSNPTDIWRHTWKFLEIHPILELVFENLLPYKSPLLNYQTLNKNIDIKYIFLIRGRNLRGYRTPWAFE